MRKLLALALVLAVSVCIAQTTIAPGGAIYNTSTGVFVGFVNRNTGAEEAMGRRTTQLTAPTCTANCGTSPSITGSDTAMMLVMGASGVPTSGFVITFNKAWPVAPACVATPALGTMAAGKMVRDMTSTTTTLTVDTNGTAPANSDQYAILCFGVN